MSDTKLLRCPFCGKMPRVKYHSARATYSVNCRNEECAVQPDMSFMFEHERHAIEQWNTRTPDPLLEQMAKALEAMADQLHQRGDDAYCAYVRQMSTTSCLGWEAKIAAGKFGDLELGAHTFGGNLHGQHRAYRDAERVVRAALAAYRASVGEKERP